MERKPAVKNLSGRADLNRRPPRPKRGALPNCATPRADESIIASMDNRQAAAFFVWMAAFFAWISACAPSNNPIASDTTAPATPTRLIPTRTHTPPAPNARFCREERGSVEEIPFDSTALPHFQIYLPPCYNFDSATRYPVLYLLHGAGFTDAQWIRLGVHKAADALISSEEIPALIIVMPYDKYSLNLIDEDDFGNVLIDDLLPYIDKHYRTRRDKRAIGGLSRGGGWAIRYGLTRPELFVAVGGHSPAIFYQDQARLMAWLSKIPADELPAFYLDAGDRDQEREVGLKFAEILSQAGIPHEWRLYIGLHDEVYWQAHTKEYLFWYGNVLR